MIKEDCTYQGGNFYLMVWQGDRVIKRIITYDEVSCSKIDILRANLDIMRDNLNAFGK